MKYKAWIAILSWCASSLALSAEQNDTARISRTLANAPFGTAKMIGTLNERSLNEVSGIAPSRRDENRFWVLNDGGHPPSVYLIDASGKLFGEAKIALPNNRDWEDLASFSFKGESYLLIADVGDNLSRRNDVALYIVKEPMSSNIKETVPILSSILFQFEDGPRDCEAVAVDISQKRILLVSKRTNPPLLYELPLSMNTTKGKVIARQIGEVKHLPNPTTDDLRERPIVGIYGAQPTAMDITKSGNEMVLLTYKQAYVYKKRGDSWRGVLESPPQVLSFPLMSQAESVSYSADGDSVIVVSEDVGTPIYRFDRLPQR